MKQELTETRVTEIWQQVVKSGTRLFTTERQRVQVVYPGRPSDEPGADFKDAVLFIGGRLTQGDIELHVHSSDWRTHGHHRNKTYNGIVLHVVMQHNTEDKTCLENGASVPMISLEAQREIVETHSKMLSPESNCRGSVIGINEEKKVNILDRAGEERFREKQSDFGHELKSTDEAQCLYRGIMGALGYSRNIVPFQMVAEKLPIEFLESVMQNTQEEMVLGCLEALLLGTAGFLPSQRTDFILPAGGDMWLQNLEKEWQVSGIKPGLSIWDWQLFRVRPGNYPARRLAGMARLLKRYCTGGLLKSLMELVEKASTDNCLEIEDGLLVPAKDYWADHFAPGKKCTKLDHFLIGRSRAKEIVVNVLLPFASAYDQSGLGKKALVLYSQILPSEENTIEKHMRIQLGLKSSQINTARRQQGLLHIYKRFCTKGRCSECPLK